MMFALTILAVSVGSFRVCPPFVLHLPARSSSSRSRACIDEFERRAPHSLLKVRGRRWQHAHIRVAGAIERCRRRGIQQDTLKAGDRVVASGNPHREFEQNRILNFSVGGWWLVVGRTYVCGFSRTACR